MRGSMFMSNKQQLSCVYLFARSTGWSILDEPLSLDRLPVTTTSPWNLPARPMPRRIELIRQVSTLALRSGGSSCACALDIPLISSNLVSLIGRLHNWAWPLADSPGSRSSAAATRKIGQTHFEGLAHSKTRGPRRPHQCRQTGEPAQRWSADGSSVVRMFRPLEPFHRSGKTPC